MCNLFVIAFRTLVLITTTNQSASIRDPKLTQTLTPQVAELKLLLLSRKDKASIMVVTQIMFPVNADAQVVKVRADCQEHQSMTDETKTRHKTRTKKGAKAANRATKEGRGANTDTVNVAI